LIRVAYTPQYYLKVDSSFGNPQGSGWYDEGVSANFSVSSPTYDNLAAKHTLTGWTGDYTGREPTGSVQMDGPRTVEATWESDYTFTYVLIGGIGALVILISIHMTRASRRASKD
jgi:hypothetical protein